jgi:hypothetical protein
MNVYAPCVGYVILWPFIADLFSKKKIFSVVGFSAHIDSVRRNMSLVDAVGRA